MTETEKKMIAERWAKAVMACGKAIKHSHNVIDFRVMNRKEFGTWKQSNPSSCVGGWPMVKKSHKFIGILKVRYLSGALTYAVSNNQPDLAGSSVIKHAMERFSDRKSGPVYMTLKRFLAKYVRLLTD